MCMFLVFMNLPKLPISRTLSNESRSADFRPNRSETGRKRCRKYWNGHLSASPFEIFRHDLAKLTRNKSKINRSTMSMMIYNEKLLLCYITEPFPTCNNHITFRCVIPRWHICLAQVDATWLLTQTLLHFCRSSFHSFPSLMIIKKHMQMQGSVCWPLATSPFH